MTFSGLETVLISGGSAFAACVASIVTLTRWFVSKAECRRQHRADNTFVTRSECQLTHQNTQTSNEALQREIAKLTGTLDRFAGRLNRKQDLQFRMIRALIVNSDMTKEKKNEILNMTNGK